MKPKLSEKIFISDNNRKKVYVLYSQKDTEGKINGYIAVCIKMY